MGRGETPPLALAKAACFRVMIVLVIVEIRTKVL